jgi:hypothetical protein
MCSLKTEIKRKEKKIETLSILIDVVVSGTHMETVGTTTPKTVVSDYMNH